jgi:hypothetical protein
MAIENRLDEAEGYLKQALHLDPFFAPARMNHSLLCLLRGNLGQGWPDYECRWATAGKSLRHFAQPRWDGSRLKGRTVLLYAEQGFGDTMQFSRYVPLVRERGAKLILECQPTLVPLLQMQPLTENDHWVAGGSPLPPFDVQAALLSLPGILGTTLATIPNAIPYLHADTVLVRHWRGVLQDRRLLDSSHEIDHSPPHSPCFLVGIAWQGNPEHGDDWRRSIPPTQFARLAEIPGVRLINLQKARGRTRSESYSMPQSVAHAFASFDEASGPFMDTAAIMNCLDLVICSDSAVTHLAGALGVPAWLALPLLPDWRWLLERDDSPWYPTIRLFRQTRTGTWDDVFDRMAEELNKMRDHVSKVKR